MQQGAWLLLQVVHLEIASLSKNTLHFLVSLYFIFLDMICFLKNIVTKEPIVVAN